MFQNCPYKRCQTKTCQAGFVLTSAIVLAGVGFGLHKGWKLLKQKWYPAETKTTSQETTQETSDKVEAVAIEETPAF